MNFRQILSHRYISILAPFKKELVLVLLILISLSFGLRPTHSESDRRYDIWQIQGPQEVKGDTVVDTVQREQIRELEIVPIKYERPAATPVPSQPEKTYGESRQIDDTTWTMEIDNDSSMGTSSQIIQALNVYRGKRGVSALSYDQNLSLYAQGRADFFAGQGGMDGHAGFQDFIHNQDGFTKMGFYSLGENSSFGYHLEAVHLIEGVFAGDTPHDSNQLNPEWTHVGVGVNGTAVDIVFGGKKQ